SPVDPCTCPGPAPSRRPARRPYRSPITPVPETILLSTFGVLAKFNESGVLPHLFSRTPLSLTGATRSRADLVAAAMRYLAGQLDRRFGRVGSVADVKIAPGGSASVFVLHEGYVGRDGDDGRVAGTVTLILDGDAVIVVDPGMVASRDDLLAALAAHGPSVLLLRTPGHTAEDISTIASTPDDGFACTHTWWGANGPAEDPLGSDASALHASREKLLSFATVIVPGHGAAFRPGQNTPR